MELHQDFKELFELLIKYEVNFVLVGAYALALHGAPRYTGDLDILIESQENNAKKILQALDEFGFGSLGITEGDLLVPGKVIQLGQPPVRIDFITSITGVEWKEVYKNREEAMCGNLRLPYIGKDQLIKNKKATARKRDLADIEALGEEE